MEGGGLIGEDALEEGLDHGVLGGEEHLVDVTVGGDAGMPDEGDVIGDASGEAHLVGGEDEVAAFGTEFGDEVEHFGGHFGVEGGGGFVEEEEPGFDGDGAGDGDALFLATGELGGSFIGVRGEVEAAEPMVGGGAGVGGWEGVDSEEGEFDVLSGGEVGEEVVGLEDEADVGAVEAEGEVVAEGDGGAVEFDGAGVG